MARLAIGGELLPAPSPHPSHIKALHQPDLQSCLISPPSVLKHVVPEPCVFYNYYSLLSKTIWCQSGSAGVNARVEPGHRTELARRLGRLGIWVRVLGFLPIVAARRLFIMTERGSNGSKFRDTLNARRVELVVMGASVILGLAFMLVGLPPVGGICFLVAFICALITVIKTMSEKRDGSSIL